VHEWILEPAGTEGYEKAEVTVGGVDTDELSSRTMESRKVPGLFFIGEVVDVTGHLGGFNFSGLGPRARRREESYRCERSQSARDRPNVLQCIDTTLRGSGLVFR